jgi:hypothetical protein
MPIHLDTPKDILGPRNAPVVRRVAHITDMDPAAYCRTASATLLVCAARAVARAAAAEVEAARRREDGSLLQDHGVVVDVFGEDGGHDGEEFWVRLEALRRHWQRGCGADGELGCWGFGGEERKERLGGVDRVFVDELGGLVGL